ncbi:MAG: hypothetical protein HC853_12565 [Anaerolineae bacterium]|nr:hypothetical protein [Anaerolineae bacterium]
MTATFVYATSSYGLASRGRAFDFVNQKPSTLYNLPAYQVNVTTSCGHEWALRWQELITTTVSPGSPYAWTTKVITWQPLSLVTYGVTTPYAIQTQSQSGGVFNGTTYLDAQEGFWVPVIEVQSTLTNP